MRSWDGFFDVSKINATYLRTAERIEHVAMASDSITLSFIQVRGFSEKSHKNLALQLKVDAIV